MKALKNKVAIVTGAGSGIGKATAELFAAEGATLVLADINEQNMEAVALKINMDNESLTCFPADVSIESHIDSLFSYIYQKYKSLDILVNNAGIMDNFTPAADVTSELWDKVLGVNLNGPFYTCRAALKHFLKQESGVIINISSIGSLYGGRAGAAYTVSKHALIGLTKSIAYQYALKGIRCNAIAPGAVDTNIVYGMEANPFGLDRMNAGAGNNPAIAEPGQIAEIALFLASEKAEFINGSVIVADGGWTAY